MPEGLEVEIYRRAAVALAGRTVGRVVVDERVCDPGVADALAGSTFDVPSRVGKVLVLPTDGPVVGIHFGMTGRLVVDEVAPIDRLEYGSGRDDPAWDRLVVDLVDGGCLRVNDPRRWATVMLEPDTSRLGPDVLTIGEDDLRRALVDRSRPVKGALLDQHLVAGLGNLCVDEVLWHAAIDPSRPAGAVAEEPDAVARLHRAISTELPRMLARGGSHRGTLSPSVRSALPPCPVDGRALVRGRVAGRTTVWCRWHQE